MAHRYIPPGRDDDEQDLRDVVHPTYQGPQESDLDRPESDGGGGGGGWTRRLGVAAMTLAAAGLVMSLLLPLVGGGRSRHAAQSPAGPGLESATVKRVLDGATIVVTKDGRETTVRYIGVGTGGSGDALYATAALANETWVTGKDVLMEKDELDADVEGRLLRYVYLDGAMVNAALIASGFATHQPQPPNNQYDTALASLENAAREAGRGIWGDLALQ